MEVKKQDNYIEITFESKLNYKLYEQFEKIQNVDKNNIKIIYLDFSNTKYISLSGAIFIVYFLNYLKTLNISFETRITSINENTAVILAKYGFLKCSKFYCNLQLDNTLEKINNRYLKNFDLANIHNQYSFYWPIKTIPEKSGNYFESDESGFTNSFIDYFNLLVEQGKLKPVESSLEEVRVGFIKTVYELGKNIWEHSQSWGLSAIQSTTKTNTTLAICDYGIGFIGSYIAKNPNYERSQKNDKKLIEWLLIEGNSSKSKDKNGHGLTRVMDFTRQVKGVLLIRTDNFEITLKEAQLKPIIKERKYFKGTQVFINF